MVLIQLLVLIIVVVILLHLINGDFIIDLSDLPDGWERKALLIIGVVFIISVIYAFHPFQGTAPNDTGNDTTPTQTVTYTHPSQPQVVNNSTNKSTTNLTANLTVDQAKNIALQSNPGYGVGQPVQGSVVVNSTNHNVWIIPLSLNGRSKTIYIDINTGLIVLNT